MEREGLAIDEVFINEKIIQRVTFAQSILHLNILSI